MRFHMSNPLMILMIVIIIIMIIIIVIIIIPIIITIIILNEFNHLYFFYGCKSSSEKNMKNSGLNRGIEL